MIDRMLEAPAKHSYCSSDDGNRTANHPAILKLLIDNLKESWRQVYTIEFETVAMETRPHMVQVVGPNEMVVHFKFKMRMKGINSRLNLAFPTLVLEPIIHIFDQDWNKRKKITNDGALLSQLRQVPVNVSIETIETQFLSSR
jgi:flagellar motor switch protein FliM